MAGTYSRNFQQLFTAFQNQAALAYLPAFTAGITAERRFMLKATDSYMAALALPTASGTFGLAMQQFGYSAYRQQALGIAYGRKLGNSMSIGMQAGYLSKTIPQYGSTGAVIVELGSLLHISPQLHAGIHAFNPARQKLNGMGKEQLPVIYTAGMGYEAAANFMISVAVIQEDDAALITQVMCEYRIIPQLLLQLGLSTDPRFSCAAAGFSLGALQLFISAAHHPQLGFTPGTSIVWQHRKKEVL